MILKKLNIGNMKTQEFVSKWIFYIPGDKIDFLCDEFDFDFSDGDVKDAIECADLKNPQSVGACIWSMVMDKLSERLKEEYPDTFNSELLDRDGLANGTDAIELYYDSEFFYDSKDFEKIMEGHGHKEEEL